MPVRLALMYHGDGLFMHFCDSNYEIPPMQQEEIR